MDGTKNKAGGGWGRLCRAVAGCSCVGFSALALADRAMPAEQREVQALDIQIEEEPTDSLLIGQVPGFILPLADPDKLGKQISAFNQSMQKQDWGEAFKILTELGEDRLDVMVPVTADGLHMSVRVQIQMQLLSLPPDGRRAFKLYFDGQAKELLDAARNHPNPGSEKQLMILQRIVDRQLASSVGGEAAELLGDLHFELGRFARAGRDWELALEFGLASGEDALRLQTKVVMARVRAGQTGKAAELYEQLRGRYRDATLTLGGQEVDALAVLGEALAAAQQAGPIKQQDAAEDRVTLPEQGQLPQWRVRFIDGPTRRKIAKNINGGNRYYYGGFATDLVRYVPPVVADDERLYLHWLGVPMALDRGSGKVVWKHGDPTQLLDTLPSMANTPAGDPRNYQIALSDDAVLVSSSKLEGNTAQFTLTAYDPARGAVLWNSAQRPSWDLSGASQSRNDTSMLGEVVVDGSAGYVVVQRSSTADNACFLMRFDPRSGEVGWTIPLGSADPYRFGYNGIRMAQPRLLIHDGLLYALTNNGALIAVDIAAGEIAWARRLNPPVTIQRDDNRGRNRFSNYNELSQYDNPNGSGRVLIHNGVLYFKEHLSKSLYAIDPLTGALQWSVDSVEPDALLFGVDDQHAYLMNDALQGYLLTGEHDRKKNDNDVGDLTHSSAMLVDGQVLALTANNNNATGRLRLFDPQSFDKTASFEFNDYLDQSGGRLYRFGDLLVTVDENQITAMRVEPKAQDKQGN